MKRAIEPLSKAECSALLAACGRGLIGLRDRALLSLLWRSQLRISEALSLRASDWDVVAGTVNVRHGKGDQQRVAVLHPSAVTDVQRWLSARQRLGGSLIFCTLRGSPLSRQAVWRRLKQLGRRAGITKRVHPHGMRHSGTRHLIEGGVPLNLVQSQLGHANLATTSRYAEILAPVARISAIGRVEM